MKYLYKVRYKDGGKTVFMSSSTIQEVVVELAMKGRPVFSVYKKKSGRTISVWDGAGFHFSFKEYVEAFNCDYFQVAHRQDFYSPSLNGAWKTMSQFEEGSFLKEVYNALMEEIEEEASI